MAQERFSSYLAYVTYAGPTELDFYQLGAVSVNPNPTHTEEFVSGLVYRQATILSHADPHISIRTADFDTIAAVVGLQLGLKCYGGNSVFQAQKRADGGVFAGLGTNTLLTCTKGFLTMDSISARQDDVQGAHMGLTFQPLWDGTNEPIAQTIAQNLSAAVPAFISQYYLGKLFYQGVQIEGVQGFQLSTGVRFVPKRADGDPWARKGSIVQIAPVLQVMLDGTMVNSATTSFFNHSTIGGNIDIYLRKGAHGGSRVLDATTVHIRLRFAAGSSNISRHEGEGLNDCMWDWVFRPHNDLALTTGVAIPA